MADVTFTKEQQELVDKLVGEARVKAREKATTDHAAQTAKDKDTADQAALMASKEWQKLAEQREAKVKELEANTPKVAAYEVLISGMLKGTIKELGDSAKKAIDALPESMTEVEKLDWLTKNKGLFQATSGGGVGTPAASTTTKATKVKPGEISKYPIRL